MYQKLYQNCMYQKWLSRLYNTLFITLGQKRTFYPEISLIFKVQEYEFCENWDFRNVNFVKIANSEM